jgi:threonine dehydratase
MASSRVDSLRIQDAVRRLAGVVKRTPLAAFESGDPAVELRVKLECLQETGSFKARGAWNQISQLEAAERAAGVVTTSSGNHGKALAWAAQRAGVRATIVMPADAYPNKIQACRDFGAEVLLGRDRAHAEELCRERVRLGATLVHPYDAERTIQGAGTVGWEIAEDWPEVDVVIVPVGGGGLVTGCALGVRQKLGERVAVIGSEPAGAPTLTLALAAGEPVTLEEITTAVQGLCPPYAGRLNTELCAELLRGVVTLEDEVIFEAQRALVRRGGWVVEPAGAAAVAVVLARRLPGDLLAERDRRRPLRVAAVVSGGNPDPAQLERIRHAS